MKKPTKNNQPTNISIIHQNVRSLGNCVDLLEDMLRHHEENMFLCLTEHWQSQQQLNSIGIHNYHLAANFCRSEGSHGGVAVYVKEHYAHKVLKDICDLSVSGELEVAASEFVVNKRQLIVIAVYRPPNGNIHNCFYILEQVLTALFNDRKIIFVAGDFNVEMLSNNVNKNTLASIFNSFGLHQTIHEYTRITPTSKSCIDNIFTNFQGEYETHILNTPISDHTAQEFLFNIGSVDDEKFVFRRMFSVANKLNFLTRIREQSWSDVYETPSYDVNSQWCTFLSCFLNVFNENFPLRRIKVGRKKLIVSNNIEICRHKERLDILLVMSQHDNKYREVYKIAKKQYDDLLKRDRSMMYENMIQQSDNKSKCVWGICREITGKSVRNTECPIEGRTENVANEFNNFFLNIVPNLLKNIDKIPFDSNIRNNNKSIFLTPVTPAEIVNIANSFKSKYSYGCDEIPTSIIKLCVADICEVLAYVINNSFLYGIFPEQLKLAHVVPVLKKKGDPMEMVDYRPISLLPGFSKIFERAMCTRLMTFLYKSNVLNVDQHAYVESRSTQTAIFQYLQSILGHLENNNLALGFFLDLSKAYDCIDHDYLLFKMEKYGIRGNVNDWFKSYLSNRKQRVLIKKDGHVIESDIMSNRLGVPQGSNVGPFLFIVYVNDLSTANVDILSNITKYADDTNILIGAKTTAELVSQGGKVFCEISKWFSKNKLILNKDKTKTILFHTKQNRIEIPECINVGNTTLYLTNKTTFLGLQIEESLDWSEHIYKQSTRLNNVCYSIRIVGRYLNRETLLILYHANFESVLRYGIVFWGSSTYVHHLFVIQKKVLRIIEKIKFGQSCRGVFRRCSIMTVYGLYIYECLMFIFKHRKDFNLYTSSHQYSTRTADLNYPIHRLTLSEKAPQYMCIKLYNKLPASIKSLLSINEFKKRLKYLLVDLEPYCLAEYLDVVSFSE